VTRRVGEVFVEALRLGLTSFGGPIAHLGYFERTYVRKLRWLSPSDYASLVAVCQILPGPVSSKVGFLVGLRRAGWAGGIAAWLGFTLPSAIAMYAFAKLAPALQTPLMDSLLHGLKLAAVAVVAQAVWSMARRLNADVPRACIGLLAAATMLAATGAFAQVAVLIAGALLGAVACTNAEWNISPPPDVASPRVARFALALFVALLLILPLAAAGAPHGWAAFADAFYRAGALVFGGGHVVLPLLRDALVPAWLSDDAFLAGYGAAQAMPGPLFTFAAYVGASASPPGGTALAAAVALVAVFLPGLLLAVASLRVLHRLEAFPRAPAALAGVNAAVVGILAAAWYDPVWTGSVEDAGDAAIALLGLLLIEYWRVPPIVAVTACVAATLLRRLAA
jgi:chromate transporter